MIVQPSPLCLVCRIDLRFFTQISFVSVVCRSSDLSIHVRRILLAQTHCFSLLSEPWQLFQWPIFIARKICLAWKQSFRNTATFQILSFSCSCRESRFFPCPGFSPDSLVQRTSMRVRFAAWGRVKAFTLTKPLRCFGSRICHKSHAIQFTICAPNFTHTKRPLLPCDLAGKRSLVFSIYSVSVYAKTTFLFK